MRRVGDLARAAAAAAAIALLVAGLPALLATTVGWPLPHKVPGLSEIGDTLTGHQPLASATVWKILATILWLAWLQITAAAVSEGASVARGSLPRPTPGFGLAHGLVAPLVATIVLAWPAGAVTRAGGAPAPVAIRADPPPTTIIATPPPLTSENETSSPAPEAITEHTVQRRDTLWDLAERYLGDGYRATELFDLNRGVRQPDGGALTDPGLVRPGWILRVPVPDATPTEVGDVVVEPGDTLWDIAEHDLGDGDRYPELFALNAGRPQPDGDTLTDASLIRPGWRLDLPTSAATEKRPTESQAAPPPASPAPTPPPDPTPPPPTTQPEATAQPTSPNHDGGNDEAASARAALGVAGAMLGAGIAATVTLRRRRRRTQRGAGLELPQLPATTTELVGELASDLTDAALSIAGAIRELAPRLADRQPIPIPLVASVDDGQLELLLDRHADAPPGWAADALGWIWRTPLANVPRPDGTPWLPGLVAIGATGEGGLLLNVEALGTIGVVGDKSSASQLGTSITMELATGVLASGTTVHVVDGGPWARRAIPGVVVHGSLDDAIRAARSHVGTIQRAMQSSRVEHVFELRCRAGDEPWPPAVVVADYDDKNEELIAELVKETGTRTGIVAVIVGGCPNGATEVHVSADMVTVPALGLACAAQSLDAPTADQVATLLAAADEPAVPPTDEPPMTLFDAVETPCASESTRTRVRLRVLGAIRVDGVELKPQQLAVVAYLCLHPDATADSLRDAVWGGRPPTHERFLNTMHELRRAVGGDILPASTNGRYRVRGITCDAHDFERLRTAALTDPAHVDASTLRAALDIVTGPPLTYESRHRRHFTWIDLGNHANRWERIVCDAAHDLVVAALESGESQLARWAAERGLVASPTSELLTRDLVGVHLALGDRRAAERTADAYARLLEDLGLDEPQALYDLLDARQAS